jgi:hypothetical protein
LIREEPNRGGAHFVDRELKAILGNKRVDREHKHTNSRVGKGRVGDQQATFEHLQGVLTLNR